MFSDPLSRVLKAFSGIKPTLRQMGLNARFKWAGARSRFVYRDPRQLNSLVEAYNNALQEAIVRPGEFLRMHNEFTWVEVMNFMVGLNAAAINFATGYRVFRPTHSQCESLCRPVTAPWNTWHLPYESFYIVPPPSFTQMVEEKRQKYFPDDNIHRTIEWMSLTRDGNDSILLTIDGMGDSVGGGVYPIPCHEKTMGENYWQYYLNLDESPRIRGIYLTDRLYWRLAINSALSLIRHGRVAGFRNKDEKQRYARGNGEGYTLPRRIVLDQELQHEVGLVENTYARQAQSAPTGKTVTPHTRTGHMHTYWTGPGRTVPVLRFVRETVVNARFLPHGEIPDTTINGK